MAYKVAYMTPMGWFIYEDTPFAKKSSADTFIENEPAEYKKRLFVVSYEGIRDGRPWWEKTND